MEVKMENEHFIKAREDKELADKERLDKHKKILELLNGEQSENLLAGAFRRIATWTVGNTCDVYYINEWTKVLNDLSLYESIILNPKNHHLRQNTPFRMSDIII